MSGDSPSGKNLRERLSQKSRIIALVSGSVAKITSTSWTAYVGPVSFSSGDAAWSLMLGVARSVASSGWHVVVLSGDDPELREELWGQRRRFKTRKVG